MPEIVVVEIGFIDTKLGGYSNWFFRRLQKRIDRRKWGWMVRSLQRFAKIRNTRCMMGSNIIHYTMRTTHSLISYIFFFTAKLYHVVSDELKLIYF